MIDKDAMYDSIRKEILDQKKCQFQLFAAAITLTAAILAYGAAAKVGPLVYTAPLLMNLLSLMIILDKAVSIQRMVGYLQLMEREELRDTTWMWEYHLNLFRAAPLTSEGSESYRKHGYVLKVAMMLLVLNVIASILYFAGPEAVTLRKSRDFVSVIEFYGFVHALVTVVNLLGFMLAIRRWRQLVNGPYTSKAIRCRWQKVLASSGVREAGSSAAMGLTELGAPANH